MSEKTYTANGYTYTVQDNGTVTAKGKVSENPASRKGMSSIHPDGYDSKSHDKGHLIAAREGGVAADYNVSAQDRGLNRGSYKVMENSEVDLANKGYDVQTEKTAYVSRPGAEPDAYMVNDTITTPDGKTHTVNASFTNLSKSDMEKIDNDLNNLSENERELSEPYHEGMTKEEYNSMMQETENETYSVKDEFDMDNTYSTQPGEEGAAALGTTGASSGVLDNDPDDFTGDTPSMDSQGSSGILDNDPSEFAGDTPSVDSSVSAAPAGESSATADTGEESGEGSSVSDGGEGSDGGGGDDGEGMD